MKPYPKYDFSVSVRHQVWEEYPDTAQFYQDIFWVSLNFTVSIMFVPDIVKELQSEINLTLIDLDNITSKSEARIDSALTSRYVVTPSDELAGKEKVINKKILKTRIFKDEDPRMIPKNIGDCIFFFVTPQEFDEFISELHEFSMEFSSLRSSLPVSKIKELSFPQLILSRVIHSEHFLEQDLNIIGRTRLRVEEE